MIDTASIIRQLKIDQITDTPNPTLEWFNELWSSLSVVQTNVYNTIGGEYIYYIKDNYPNDLINKIPVFYINYTMNQIHYDYDHYSSHFYTNEPIDYIPSDRLKDLTKLLLSTVLPGNILTPIEYHLE
jgi:hypothetical protein